MSGICDKTSNNKFFDCPALMSDGRLFTDYRPNGYLMNLIKIKNNIHNSYDLRQFIMNNSDTIKNEIDAYYNQQASCPCSFYSQTPTYGYNYVQEHLVSRNSLPPSKNGGKTLNGFQF